MIYISQVTVRMHTKQLAPVKDGREEKDAIEFLILEKNLSAPADEWKIAGVFHAREGRNELAVWFFFKRSFVMICFIWKCLYSYMYVYYK